VSERERRAAKRAPSISIGLEDRVSASFLGTLGADDAIEVLQDGLVCLPGKSGGVTTVGATWALGTVL
jgi:hypothetical protein